MKFALWMMNRFQVNTSLRGDLTEEWNTGHSAWWLMRQTGVAIARAVGAGIWQHKLVTVVAVGIGWLGWVLLGSAIFYILGPYPHFPIGLVLFIVRPILLGWIVGKLQPNQPLGTVLFYIATFLTTLLILTLGRGGVHSLENYRFILLFGAWLILTTTVGGLLAASKTNSSPIPG